MTGDDHTFEPEDRVLGERIAHHLRRQAAEVSPVEAWDDLASRVTRDARRRERVLAGALALVLVAGPAAGFLIARAGGDDEAVSVRAAGEDEEGDGGDEATPDEPGPTAVEEPFDGASEGGAGVVYGGQGMALDGMVFDPYDLVFLRSTSDGIDIRAYREDYEAPTFPEQPDWTPPPGCFPTGSAVAELSSEYMVGEVWGSLYGEPDGGLAATLGLVGVREGEPAWVVVAEAPGAATVRARFADGATDEMQPVDGVAVLAHRAPLSEPVDADTGQELFSAGAVAEALDGGGNVIASFDLNGEIVYRDECEPPPPPPPTLPQPGAEQPADVDAARAEVIQAYADAFTGTNDEATRQAAIERSDELASVFADLESGTFAELVADARAEVRDVVFVSATEAAVLFDIVIEDYSDFPNRIGGAVLADGRWKVSYDTVCEAVSLATTSCPGQEVEAVG